MTTVGKIRSVDTTICEIWEINDFTSLRTAREYSVSSPTFYVQQLGDSTWVLQCYPGGSGNASEGFVSIFLRLKSCSTDRIELNVDLTILSEDDDNSKSRQFKHTFHPEDLQVKEENSTDHWGFPKFIEREQLVDPCKKMLKDNVLSIRCRMWSVLANEELPTSVTDRICVRTSLWEQYLNQKLTDVTLIVGGKEFKLHKIVLAIYSPVFAAMFDTNMEEAKGNIVSISDCEPDTFEEFIKFLYLGESEKLDRFNSELLVIAEKYAVDALKDVCEKSIYSTLSVSNAIEILRLADLHNANWLKRKTLEFIKNNAFDVTQSKDWNSLVSSPRLISDVFSFVVKDMPRNFS